MRLLPVQNKSFTIYSLYAIKRTKLFKPMVIGLGLMLLVILGNSIKSVFQAGRGEEEIARITQELDDYVMKLNSLNLVKEVELINREDVLLYVSMLEKEEGLRVVSKNITVGKKTIEGENFDTVEFNVVYGGSVEGLQNFIYRLTEEVKWVEFKSIKFAGGNINAVFTVYTK